MNRSAPLQDWIYQYITPRRLRFLKESITGYLFIAPAVILIFLFGIFPVGFALYVSLHKWRIQRTDFVGLGNYVRSVGDIAYVAAFILGVGALIGGVLIFRRILQQAKELNQKPWLLGILAILHSITVFAFLRYFWYQLPEFLDIAVKIRGVEKTRELFLQLLRESFYATEVNNAWQFFLIALTVSIIGGILGLILYKKPNVTQFQNQFSLMWIAISAGLGLLYFTYQQIAGVYQSALETNSDPGIWPQVVVISAGILLFVGGWYLWRTAPKMKQTWKFWLRIFGAFILLVGGWILVGEIPTIMATGDKDLWDGIRVTIFFSAGTVPFQLTISMFLAILLFQKLRGSEFFRMVFFLPYVTPFVASAAIFRQIFANRDTSPMNLVIRGLGGEGLAWLQESKGIVDMIAGALGFNLSAWVENFPNLPFLYDWIAGPSLALVVVIIHAVWTYVGYDTVIYLAGLGNIPTELNEAAEIDGANKWDVFRFITFPLLSPTTYFLSLIAIIGTFKAFATIWVFREPLALGTIDTFSVAIFLEFFEKLRYGYASAMAFILFAIILGLTIINNRLQGSRVFYM